jgi:biotin carboxyl carrier protein
MKKFEFSIHGNKYGVDILNIEDNVAEIDVNGTIYKVDIHSQQKITKTPTLTRATAPPNYNPGQKTNKPTDKKGVGLIKAPLPGTILEIKKRPGDTVQVGDTILIMEAMKMENDIKADNSGVIVSIKVNVNDSVLEGDVLIEIGSGD